MFPYWLLFLVPVYMELSRLRAIPRAACSVQHDCWPNAWGGMFFILVLMIGLRHDVGGDWGTYIDMLATYSEVTENTGKYSTQDPAFILFNWLAAQAGLGIYLLNLLSAIVFSWGLVVFCRAQPRPWLALVVAVPYLITVVAMGYTRQGAAIGIAMIGMATLRQGGVWRYMFWVVLAAMFHKAALILVPLAVIINTKHRVFTLLSVGLVAVILFVIFLQDHMSFWLHGYSDVRMQSSGAMVRALMNVVPAVLFLVFRKRFQLSTRERSFWTWMALGMGLMLVLLNVLPSNTVVDRLMLFWIPLQLFVLSRLPNVLGRRYGTNVVWVLAVIGYSAVVHFIWLVYADTAFAWLPYQFYPWVWLWQ